jgi:hypothetical protein
VGSAAGVAAVMERAVTGEREQREGARGKWMAHWKMAHIVRPVGERAGADNLNLQNHDLERAQQRIASCLDAFRRDGTRLTRNPDFET